MRDGEARCAAFHDAGLLGGDQLDGITEEVHVIEADGRDAARDGRLDDVRRIVQTSDANFENADVDLTLVP